MAEERNVTVRLYDEPRSGNCYKVRLLLTQLSVAFECVPIDVFGGGTRTPEFLAKNPNGRVPLVEWPDGRRLAESNAILVHFAQDTPFLPDDSWQRAQALQWLFFEQYSHEPYIAVPRFWHLSGNVPRDRDQLDAVMRRGYQALGVMELHLKDHDYLVAERYSIADVALYAYTHVAHEGGFELDEFVAVRAWLDRIASQAGHIKITDAAGTEVAR